MYCFSVRPFVVVTGRLAKLLNLFGFTGFHIFRNPTEKGSDLCPRYSSIQIGMETGAEID